MQLARWIRRAALLLTLASAIPALAQSGRTATLAVNPSAPTTDDVVSVTLFGVWPDSCTPGSWGDPTIVRQPEAFFTIVYPDKTTGGGCAAVLTPWRQTVNLGRLSPGGVVVEATIARGLLPAETLGSVTFNVTPPQVVHVFVPSFLAPGEPTLESRLSAYHNAAGTASIAFVAAYDEFGRHALPETMIPVGGWTGPLDTSSVTPGSVRFLEVATTTHVVLHATLERERGGTPEGRVALPVFTAPFRADTTTAIGAIDTGAGFLRANLTLFNAGTAPATFFVAVTTEEAPIGESFVVEPQTTRQVNSILPAGGGTRWLSVTADQPYLAYASAVYSGPIPYEIFPAKTEF